MRRLCDNDYLETSMLLSEAGIPFIHILSRESALPKCPHPDRLVRRHRLMGARLRPCTRRSTACLLLALHSKKDPRVRPAQSHKNDKSAKIQKQTGEFDA